jgi:dipeptidyl aminopeptidase/acylaminoacyl peptidase
MQVNTVFRKKFFIVLFIAVIAFPAASRLTGQDTQNQDEAEQLRRQLESMRHSFEQLEKHVDDVLWFQRVGDIALVDKVRLTGPPLWKEKNPAAQGAGNPVKFYAYVFIPRSLDPEKKYPLLVFPHGGVHSNFTTYNAHIVRELIAQGYVIIAADYRGSTGYGAGMYRLIDYGGREVEDVYASRNYMLENYTFCDPDRVGILGWSHGGLITLMNIFDHPRDYKVAFAGVPVSDLIARMGYKTQGYRDLYSAGYHIGQTAYENVEEYRRRSPAWQAEKLQTPLLIHTNTNDEDVNVLEVEHLIKSLKAAGKEFEYTIYRDKPGGHSFDRLDTWEAKTIRLKIYDFLNKHLNPPSPLKSVEELHSAGYRTPVQR